MYKLLIVKAPSEGKKPYFISIVFPVQADFILTIRKRLRYFINNFSILFCYYRIILNICIEILSDL